MRQRPIIVRTPTLYLTPIGYSTKRPKVVLPAIDRRGLIADAHALARKVRATFSSYRHALVYGLSAVWARIKVARSILSLKLQVRDVPLTAARVAASARATRRVGSSMVGA